MSELQTRYEVAVTKLLKLGNWLAGPGARTLPEEQWELLFQQYEAQLAEVRRLGDERRAALRAQPIAPSLRPGCSADGVRPSEDPADAEV